MRISGLVMAMKRTSMGKDQQLSPEFYRACPTESRQHRKADLKKEFPQLSQNSWHKGGKSMSESENEFI